MRGFWRLSAGSAGASLYLALVPASALGTAPAAPGGIVAPSASVASGDSLALDFPAPAAAAGQCRVLAFDARMESPRFNGSNLVLGVFLNGSPVPASRLVNKAPLFATARHVLMTWGDESQLRVVYSPRFDTDLNTNAGEHRILDSDPFHFEFRVDDLLRPAGNRLVIVHRIAGLPPVQLAKVRLLDAPCNGPGAAAKPSHQDSVFVAQAPAPPPPATARVTAEGAVAIACDSIRSLLDTEVSIPRGRWRSLSRRDDWRTHECEAARTVATAMGVRVTRTVVPGDGYIEIRDTWCNTAVAAQGFLVRYRLRAIAGAETWLGGVQLPARPLAFTRSEPQAPSAVQAGRQGALGLVPGNDVLWVHAESFRDSLGAGLVDAQLCVPPRDSVQLAVRVVAAPGGSAFDWNSRVRSLLGPGIALPGGFAFGTFAMNRWPPERLREWIRIRGLQFLASPPPTASGSHGLQGPALLRSDSAQTELREFAAAVHRASPQTKVLAYFHAYLINASAMRPEFQSQQMRFQNGTTAFYPRVSAPAEFAIMVPTPGSAFATSLEAVVRLNWDLGFDGLYWDEMSFSYRPWTYGGDGDGASGDVDPSSHLLLRTKTSIPLAVQPWIRSVLAAARKSGKVVVANTQAATFSMHQEPIPRFVETPDDLSIAAVALGTPIALADRRRERDARDAAGRMRAHLENAALYYYYSPAVTITAPALAAYQFPITPWVVRPGLIAGPERILTSRSGRFGWGDASTHEVHVFDAAGIEQSSGSRTLVTGGRTWTDVTLPDGGCAAIVRQTAH